MECDEGREQDYRLARKLTLEQREVLGREDVIRSGFQWNHHGSNETLSTGRAIDRQEGHSKQPTTV